MKIYHFIKFMEYYFLTKKNVALGMYSHCIHNWQNLKHQDSLQSMHEYVNCAPLTTEYYSVLKRSEIHQAMERYRRKKTDV